MSTEFAYLPPLPPIASAFAVATPAARLPSERGETLMAATTVLLAGITGLIWTAQLDTTGSQIFVAAAAVLTVILPTATFDLMRAASRRR
jgi:hypothetical protein